MKKLIAITVMLTIAAHAAHAGWYQNAYINTCGVDAERCAIHRLDPDRKWSSSKNGLYMCGNQNDVWCCDRDVQGYGYKRTFLHGDAVKLHGAPKMYCCNGAWNKVGRWVFAEKFSETTMKTIELPGGGTCNYPETVDICGNVTPPCTVPDPKTCPAGTLYRNKECVPLCIGDDMAFESPTSNKCIKCEKSLYRGRSEDGTCTQCNSSNQIFDRSAAACKKKSEFTQYPGLAFKRCYACSSYNMFNNCVRIFSLPVGSTGFKTDEYNAVAKDCLIPQDQLPDLPTQ